MIAQNRAQLLAQHFCVATPDWDTIQWAYDKRLTPTAARPHSASIFRPAFIPAAWTKSSGSTAAFRSFSTRPVRKTTDGSHKPRPGGPTTATHLLRALPARRGLVGDDAVIVQEWIPGSGEQQFSFAGLWERGEPVVSLVARRRRHIRSISAARALTLRPSSKAKSKNSLAAS